MAISMSFAVGNFVTFGLFLFMFCTFHTHSTRSYTQHITYTHQTHALYTRLKFSKNVIYEEKT